jgi:hypothetical protein
MTMHTTHVAIVRDHSASMRPLVAGAANDYNLMLSGIRDSVTELNQTAYLTVVECGVGYNGNVRVPQRSLNVTACDPLTRYHADGGGTPLFDSVGTAIDELQRASGVNNAYLVMVITDGAENRSRTWSARTLADRISKLQATNRWTFVFRVPVGHKRGFVALGIPEGNVVEWEQTNDSLVRSTERTVAATKSFFTARSAGRTSTNSFYADLSADLATSVNELVDVSDKFTLLFVPEVADGMQISEFVRKNLGDYIVGRAHYELTKPEKVQASKDLVIVENLTGKTYEGRSARRLLGLPDGDVRIYPGKTDGQYSLFVQSSSVNRKLVGKTRLLYRK